jgi:hypothetical protein
MEAVRSTETSVPTRTTRRYIPEDGILHNHHLESLRSYIAVPYGGLIITFDEATASHVYLHGDT